jgi:hypothetical protein
LIGHRTFLIGDGYGIILGGRTRDRTINADVIFFEEWGARVCPLACTGFSPLGRNRSSFVMIGNFVLCIGGPVRCPAPECFALDLITCTWQLISGHWGCFHSASACVIGDTAYIHGGIDKRFYWRSSLLQLSLGGSDPRPPPTVEQLRAFATDAPILQPLRESR